MGEKDEIESRVGGSPLLRVKPLTGINKRDKTIAASPTTHV